jgi:hypothetical protein
MRYSLRLLKACLRYNSVAIRWVVKHGRPELEMPVPADSSFTLQTGTYSNV